MVENIFGMVDESNHYEHWVGMAEGWFKSRHQEKMWRCLFRAVSGYHII